MFDLREDDVYWCTADVGWITGHSYIVYGPLANGATVVMYEGAPNDTPPGPLLGDVREARGDGLLHRADRDSAFMKWGDEHVAKHDLSKLRLLGTVGEPINPEAGCGITDHRRASAAPSWTPGGRPRRAGS